MLNPKLINDPNGCCHCPIYMSCPARRQGLTKLSCLLSCNHRHLSQFLAGGLLPDLCQHCPLDTDQNSGKLSSKHHLLFIGIKMLLENHILFTSYNCIIFIFAKIKKTRKEVDFIFYKFYIKHFLSFSSSTDDYCLLFIATGDILSRFVTVPQFTFTVYYRILTGWLDSFFGSTFDKGNSLDFSKAHRLESLILWHL